MNRIFEELHKAGGEIIDPATAADAQRPLDRLVTRREAAGEKAAETLSELAAELRADGKTYGAAQIEKMAAEAARWGRVM